MISREEAVKNLDNLYSKIIHTTFCNRVRNVELDALVMAKKILEQPKADKWIPCEVDMPKEIGRYIVTLKDGRSLEAIYDNITKRFIMYEHEVIAWMPLPQPYKKEGAE